MLTVAEIVKSRTKLPIEKSLISNIDISGKIGEMTSSKHTSRVNIGDNKEEVIQKFKEMQILIHNDNTKKVYMELKYSFFMPLQEIIKNMRFELNRFEEDIKNLKKELS